MTWWKKHWSLASPRPMTTEPQYPACVRCGFCCKQAICPMGLRQRHAERSQSWDRRGGCKFLVGDRPGDYACQLIVDHPELGDEVAIGYGCSSTLLNDARREALRRKTDEPKSA